MLPAELQIASPLWKPVLLSSIIVGDSGVLAPKFLGTLEYSAWCLGLHKTACHRVVLAGCARRMLRLRNITVRRQWTEQQISLQHGLRVPLSATPVGFQFAVQPGACSLHSNLKSTTALHPDGKTGFWTQLKHWLWSNTFFSWAVTINTSPRLSPTLVSMWRATLFFSDSQNFFCLNCRHALWKTERFIYNWLDLQACFITLFPAQSFLILNRNYYENFLLQGISRLAGLKQNLSLLVQFYFWKNLLNWARVQVHKGNTYTHNICARTQWVSSNSCCGTFSRMALNYRWAVALIAWWPSFFLAESSKKYFANVSQAQEYP